jgi:hypothetical protein
MRVGDDMHQLSRHHVIDLCQHIDQHRILHDVPVVRSQDVLRSLVQNAVQNEAAAAAFALSAAAFFAYSR